MSRRASLALVLVAALALSAIPSGCSREAAAAELHVTYYFMPG